MQAERTAVLRPAEIERAITRIAHEIAERNVERPVALVGIQRRGVPLAERIQKGLSEHRGLNVLLGVIDISFYRDDLQRHPAPIVHSTQIPFSVEDHTVVLVDDVIYTGRTVRAAIDAIFDYGRPPRIQLAAMIDRGHRELPIRPDFVGKNLPTSGRQRVDVRLREVDGSDEVLVVEGDGSGQ